MENKPRIKIKNWSFEKGTLVGTVDDHHYLKITPQRNEIRTSKIVKVETKNTIYELEGPMEEAIAKADEVMGR